MDSGGSWETHGQGAWICFSITQALTLRVMCILCRVMGYLFNDYWEDIGTIKSFFEANLALTQQV